MNFKGITKRLEKNYKEHAETQRNLTIGALAKRKRIMLNLTQSEVADSICSISYLSKFESNKINPNPVFLKSLMEKIHIEEWEIFILENGPKLLNEAIDAFYYLDYSKYFNLYQSVSEIKNNQTADLIKLGYYILNERYKDASVVISNNLDLANSMGNNMLMIFALFSAEYSIYECDYESANELINTLSTNSIPNSKIVTLVNDAKFRLDIKERRYTVAFEYYQELIKTYTENLQIKRIQRLKINYARIQFQEKEYSEVLNVCDSLVNYSDEYESDPEYVYLKAVALYETGRKVSSKDYFDRIDSSSPFFPKVVRYKYDLEDDKEEFMLALEKWNLKKNDFYIEYFLLKQKDALTRDVFQSKSYHKELAKSSITEMEYLLSLERDFYVSKSRYKDACIIEDRIKQIKEKAKSSQQ